jgi:hypothetical protein
MPSGPDKKSEWWRAASAVLGYVVILEIIALVTGNLWSGLTLWTVPLLIFVLLASLEFGLPWLQGRTGKPKADVDWPISKSEVPDPHAGSNYVLVQTHPPGGKSPKVTTLSPGWYLLFVLFWRAPLNLGDAILSWVYQLVGRGVGVRKETQISGSSMDLDQQEPRGPTPF